MKNRMRLMRANPPMNGKPCGWIGASCERMERTMDMLTTNLAANSLSPRPLGRGWRAQRAGRGGAVERSHDQIQYCVGPLQNIVIPKPQDLKSFLLQPPIANAIRLVLRMLAAVDFQNQF